MLYDVKLLMMGDGTNSKSTAPSHLTGQTPRGSHVNPFPWTNLLRFRQILVIFKTKLS